MALNNEVKKLSTSADGRVKNANRQRRRWWLLLCTLLIIVSVGGWNLPQIVRAHSRATAASTQSAPQTTMGTTPQAAIQTNAMAAVTTAATAAAIGSVRTGATGETIDLAPVTTAAQLSAVNQGATPIVVLVGAEGATLLAAPADPSGQPLVAGVVFTAVGRTEDGNWLAVQAVDGTSGWIATTELVVFGVTRLPVLELAAFTVNLGVAAPAPATTVALSPTVATTTAVLSETIATTAITTVATTDAAVVTTASATVTSSGRLNVRSGPGTSYTIVAKANAGDEVSVLARNDAADWVQIQMPDSPDGVGWVAARYLDFAGELADLPVSTTASSAPALVSTAAVATTSASDTTGVATVAADSGSGTLQIAATTTVATTASNTNAGAVASLSGTLVFQSSPGGMIYAYDLAAGRLWQLANGFDPAISPDGNQVAFVREGGENGLYLIKIDGSNERLIFSGRASLSSPKWSPNGQWILFTRGDEYSECVDLGRGGCVSPGSLPPGMPTDGLTLSKDYAYKLARVDPNGDNYRDIAALDSAKAADWNEAGIVYQSSAGLQITADSADATNRLLYFQALQPPVEDPDWQPNGGQVLFVQRHGSHYEIFTMNADGSGVTALTRPVTTLVDQMPNNLAPAWSPNGQQIVFLSNRAENNEAGAWRLWVMNADGSNQQPLPIDITINYTYGNEQAVSWGL